MHSARDMIERILDMSDEKRYKIFILLWRWWNARNKANAGEALDTTQMITAAVIRLMNELQKQPSAIIMQQNRMPIAWSPPPEGILKVNIDGAFVQSTKQGSWGFVFCDHSGDMVLVGAGNLAGAQDALMTEATTCWKAIEVAVAHGISRLQLETDSVLVRDAIQSTSLDQTSSGVIFKDIRAMIKEHFYLFEYFYVPRTCNSSAHEIAAIGLNQSSGSEFVWEYPIPEFVSSQVAGILARHEVN